jgi:DNA-binding protein HU-beta
MTKDELVTAIAKKLDGSKAEADRALSAVFDTISDTLKKGGEASVPGFGKFSVGKRAARQGRNPRTGEAIKIKASKTPKFKAGKALKDAVN